MKSSHEISSGDYTTTGGGLRQNADTTTTSDEITGADSVHRILTCNILLDLPEQEGNVDWETKRWAACEQVIKSKKPDILCLQEVGPGQNNDFMRAFPTFESFGYEDPYVDKKPKRFQACKNIILYSRERYEMESEGIYWLSKTPHIAGSMLPEVKLPRHVTWVRLKDKHTGRAFRVANTHWALQPSQRISESEVVARETGQYQQNFPQLLCGDFNAVTGSDEQKILLDVGWRDTYAAVHQAAGTSGTGRKIDFIFSRGGIEPVAAEIIRETVNGVRPSDHNFVSTDFKL